MSDLSIIIVTYNSANVLEKCLDSIGQSKLGNYKIEIVIVDNSSTDQTAAVVENFTQKSRDYKVKFIQNRSNIGFGAANNKALRQALGDLILLLNSDVILETDTLSKQIQFMKERPQFMASTCKLLLPSGKMDPACHRGFPTPWASLTYFSKLEKLLPKSRWFGQYHQGWKDLSKAHRVEAISGAFFMMRKELITKVGLFDEGFFMYGEDLDLCLRIAEQSYQIGFNPDSTALHLKGQSGRKKINEKNLETSKNTNYHFWNAMRLFYKKHYQKKYPSLINFLILKLIDFKSGKYKTQ